MGSVLNAIKAKLDMDMPNIIDPYRATRRYGRTGEFDLELKLTTEVGMEEFLNKFISNIEQSGDTESLKKGVSQFKKELLNILNKNEKAQKGILNHLKDEIEKWHKQKDKLTHALNDKQLRLALGQNYEIFTKEIEQAWKDIFKEVSTNLNWMADRELDISREGARLSDVSIQLDFSMKSNMGHFASREQDVEKQELKSFKKLETLLDSKKTQNISKEIQEDLKEIIKIVSSEMKLLVDELKNLLIIVRKMDESLHKIFEKHIQQKFEKELKLPEDTSKIIETEFISIFNEIRNKAKLYFEEAKYISQKAA